MFWSRDLILFQKYYFPSRTSENMESWIILSKAGKELIVNCIQSISIGYWGSPGIGSSPPTSTHYYESTSLQKPRLLPLTITNLHPLQKPRLLPLTITNLHPSRSLRSASERRLVVPSQRGSKSLSRTFSFTVPGCWNDLPPPPPIRNAGFLSIFKQQLKTNFVRQYFTSS